MSHAFHAETQRRNSAAVVFLKEMSLCFVVLTLILVGRHELAAGGGAPLPDAWAIRAGILQDLVAELPAGRQAFVSSPAFMPLPGVAALPFLPFLPPAGYGYAYLYGLALLLSIAAPALRRLLSEWGAGAWQWVALVLLGGVAAWLGATEYSDGLACLAMLILALYLESRPLVELRAVAGVFWGLALFAHAGGFPLVAARIVHGAASCVWRRWSAEDRAVAWIQGVCVAYVLVVYLFLNWMIMGSWLYPARAAVHLRAFTREQASLEPLAAALARTCPGRIPVVSGHWGYVVRPVLVGLRGYHFLDFHPAKVPAHESRPLVLVVPSARNPLARFCDIRPDGPGWAAGPVRYLRLAQTADWCFYLVDRDARAP
jgi:hypothetical protein